MKCFDAVLLCAVIASLALCALSEDNDVMEERGLKESISKISSSIGGISSLGKMFRSVNMTEIARASTKVAKELSKSLRTDVFAVGKALAGAGAALGSVVFLGGMAGLLASGLGMFRYTPELYESNYPFSINRIDQYPIVGDAQQIIYQKVQQAQQQYLNSQSPVTRRQGVQGQQQQQQQPQQPGNPQGSQSEYYGELNAQRSRSGDEPQISARDARALKDAKQPYSPDLIPALNDFFKVLSNVAESVAPGVVEKVVEAAKRR